MLLETEKRNKIIGMLWQLTHANKGVAPVKLQMPGISEDLVVLGIPIEKAEVFKVFYPE